MASPVGTLFREAGAKRHDTRGSAPRSLRAGLGNPGPCEVAQWAQDAAVCAWGGHLLEYIFSRENAAFNEAGGARVHVHGW